MTFELLDSDPIRSKAKTKTPQQKGVTTMKREKTPRVTDIRQMKTGAIVSYIAYRHRVGILSVALASSWAFFIAYGLRHML